MVELCIDSVSCERGRPGSGTGRPCDTDHTWKLGVSQFSMPSIDISHSPVELAWFARANLSMLRDLLSVLQMSLRV